MNIYLGVLIGFILGFLILFIFTEIREKCFISGDKTKLLHKQIQVLVRQAARWSTAAKQDKSSLIAVLHANYGTGYLGALKDIASDSQIKAATGINLKKFENQIISVQDQATKKMAKLCPKYAPQKSYLTTLGGEG